VLLDAFDMPVAHGDLDPTEKAFFCQIRQEFDQLLQLPPAPVTWRRALCAWRPAHLAVSTFFRAGGAKSHGHLAAPVVPGQTAGRSAVISSPAFCQYLFLHTGQIQLACGQCQPDGCSLGRIRQSQRLMPFFSVSLYSITVDISQNTHHIKIFFFGNSLIANKKSIF